VERDVRSTHADTDRDPIDLDDGGGRVDLLTDRGGPPVDADATGQDERLARASRGDPRVRQDLLDSLLRHGRSSAGLGHGEPAFLGKSGRDIDVERRKVVERRQAEALEELETRSIQDRSSWAVRSAELHQEARLASGDRFAIRARVRRLNDLGFAVDEIEVSPGGNGTEMRLRVTVSNRRFHARELQRLTGLVALEGQARLLLNDLHEYAAWVDINRRRKLSEQEGADVWLTEVLQPVVDRLRPAIGPTRDPIQAYCDVLEEKWLLSERAGTDVGLEAAIAGYLSKGAPGPETGSRSSSDISLDLVGDVASVQDDGPPGRICATE